MVYVFCILSKRCQIKRYFTELHAKLEAGRGFKSKICEIEGFLSSLKSPTERRILDRGESPARGDGKGYRELSI